MIITDIFNNAIKLTDERWQHIVREHPEVEPYKGKIQEVLLSPDYVKKSKEMRKYCFTISFMVICLTENIYL